MNIATLVKSGFLVASMVSMMGCSGVKFSGFQPNSAPSATPNTPSDAGAETDTDRDTDTNTDADPSNPPTSMTPAPGTDPNPNNPGSGSGTPTPTPTPKPGSENPGTPGMTPTPSSTPVTPPGSTPSPTPSATPKATPPVVMPPSSPTPVAPVCTERDMSTLATMMIQRYHITVNEIAFNCIDSTVPVFEDNLPYNSETQNVRFQNTCGNRYCQARYGFESGRVIEIGMDGYADIECRRSTPPSTGNSCEGVVAQNPLVNRVHVATQHVADICVDSLVPNAADSRPEVNSARFVNTCGLRFCRMNGFKDGRMIEYHGESALAECYKDPGGFFQDFKVPVSAIAQNCIDSAVPTYEQNLPQYHQQRFQTTCGDRYCRNVLGLKSGKAVEYRDGVALLTCSRY